MDKVLLSSLFYHFFKFFCNVYFLFLLLSRIPYSCPKIFFEHIMSKYHVLGWHTFRFVHGLLSRFYCVGTSINQDVEIQMFSFITTIIGNLVSVIDRILFLSCEY